MSLKNEKVRIENLKRLENKTARIQVYNDPRSTKLRHNFKEINNTLNALRKEDPKMKTLNHFFPNLLYKDIESKDE